MKRTDRGSRIIFASAETIYRAFVDPDALVRWLPPKGATGRIDAFDARVGGKYRLTLTFDPATHTAVGKSAAHEDVVEGTFVELVPNERVVQAIEFGSDNPDFAGTMIMKWLLAPAGEGRTEVSIVAENVPAAISKEDHDEGLRSTLENLAAWVETSR